MNFLKNPSFEPALITGISGLFLLLLILAKSHLFSEIAPKKAAPQILPAAVAIADTGKVISDDSLEKAIAGTTAGVDTYTGMAPFFQSCENISNSGELLHIAYFGDSMIEGDLVTHPLRRRLQKRFGGEGIGFVPITSPQPGFRTTIHLHFNDLWKVYSFVKSGIQHDIFPGLSGYAFETAPGAEASFRSGPGYGPFHQASILYGGRTPIRITMMADSTSSTITLPASTPVSSYNYKPDSMFSALNLQISSAEPGILFGVNFENGKGVYVDNYAFRGNSGLPLKQIPGSIFSGFNNVLSNKLLIIHYGLNVFTPGVDDYNWYEQALRSVISHVKATSPGIPVLMISMPDRATLIDGEYATPAELPDFIRLQKRVADQENIAFFSLFDAMGGVNSMKNWVEGKTKLAGDDYTHPNGSGASRIAELIYQYLITGYDQFTQQQDSSSVISANKTP